MRRFVDNVPGAPGIGIKTAALLINEYGDLDTLLARAGEIKQDKRRQTLIDFADQARLSKTLVILDTQVPVPVALAETAVQAPDTEALMGFLRKLEFTTLVRRIAEGLGADIPEGAAARPAAQEERLRPSVAALAARRDRGRRASRRSRAARPRSLPWRARAGSNPFRSTAPITRR